MFWVFYIFSVVQNVRMLWNVALCCACWITGMAVQCRAPVSLLSLSFSPKSTKWVRGFVFLSPSIISFVCPGFHRRAAALHSLLKRNWVLSLLSTCQLQIGSLTFFFFLGRLHKAIASTMAEKAIKRWHKHWAPIETVPWKMEGHKQLLLWHA